MTGDLVAFLRAQLDEDAEKARAALWAGYERWRAFHREVDDKWIVEDSYDEGVAVMLEQAADGEGLARHIVAWEPVRVLREIESKRRVLDECAYWNEKLSQEAVDQPQRPYPCLGEILDAVNPILRALAAPYEDRPGFRPEWRL